jgi:PAS domain S-box-containing protein
MTGSRLATLGVSIPLSAASLWLYASYVGIVGPNSANFMPHGYCYMWDPRVVWLHVITDALIGLSYYGIPIILIYFLRKRRNLPFNWIFWMFAAFILACGTTHLMEIWNIWHSDYILAGVIKAITAVLSVLTAAMLIPLTPKAIALPAVKMLNIELEAALKDLSEQKFALDQHAIVATTDVQGTITYVNDKFCAISKYSREELIGQNHRILNSGHHPKEFFQQMYHTIASGKVWHAEIKNRAKDGSTYWVDTTVVPFMNSDGKPRQYVAIRADITERKRAEDVREQLAAVVESSEDAIISENMDGTITAWNSGAEKLFGYSPAEAVGKPMLMLESSERKNQALDRLTRLGRGERVEEIDTIRVRKDGRKIDISARIFPIKDSSGAIIGASKIARDITQRKLADEEIQRLNNEMESRNKALEAQTVELQKARDELELRVKERTLELAASNQILERSNIELQQFAYVASHDLQSPLRSISGFVQVLRMEYDEKLDDQGRDYIRRTVQAIAKMQTLIRDLLAYSRVDSRSRPFEPVPLVDVFHGSVLLLESSIRDAGGQVTCDELPVVLGDGSQLTQLMQNLIGNGLKYHGTDPPHVHVSAEHGTKGNEWIVSVRDNGIGVDPKYFGRIFEIFKRLHDQKEYPGTGIGLAVCRRVVERHGGAIWVESEAGHGSNFRFSIPADAAKSTSKTETRDETSDQQSYQRETG